MDEDCRWDEKIAPSRPGVSRVDVHVRRGGLQFGAHPQSDHGSWIRKDRKSTRLNSSHLGISYAVFCLKKKKKENVDQHTTLHLTDRIQNLYANLKCPQSAR